MNKIYPIREICLGDALDQASDRWNHQIGWVLGERHVSFAEMREQADGVARALLASGIRTGDVVAALMPNLAEFAFCMMACGKIGAIIAPINTRSKRFELEHFLKHCGARLLVRVDHFLKQDFRAQVVDLCGEGTISDDGDVRSAHLPDLRKIVSVSPEPLPGALSWSSFMAAGAAVAPAELAAMQAGLRWNDPVLLQYTSGTTSLPKGALCNHRYVVNFGVNRASRLGLGEGEAALNTQPFYHIGGSCGALPLPLSIGCRVVSPAYYDVETVLSLIERERCVTRSGMTAMYLMEVEHPRFREYDLSSLRSGWIAGAPELTEDISRRSGLSKIVQLYGSTEGGGTSGSVDDSVELRTQSCGRAFPGVEILIVDPESDAILPPRVPGEIVVKGWLRMNEYLKQPVETAAVVRADGSVRTGDRGYLDEGGYLFFLGRIKNMLRVGGENVSAEEVESMLLRHPKIKLAAVIGVPDPRLQEVVMAIVELKEGAEATEREIIDFCSSRMANFRVPRFVRFTTDWPMTGSGKIQKHVLKDHFAPEDALVAGRV